MLKFEGEAEATVADYQEALFGEGPSPPLSSDEASWAQTSLPRIWGAFFRPMADGRTGAERARDSGLFDREPDASALARISDAHGVLADVVAVDLRRHVVSLRSLLDGAVYHVPSLPRDLTPLHRWMRVCTLLVGRGDGFWSQPSIITGSSFSSNVTLDGVWAEVIDRAARLGEPAPPAAPTPQALARYIGLVHAAFMRQSTPTAEQERESRKKGFAVNSDGERVEHVRVELDWQKNDQAALKQAAARGDALRREGNGWEWVGKMGPVRAPHGHDEEIKAELQESNGIWALMANSPQRIERAIAILNAALGRSLTVLRTDVMRPWEENADMASEESDDTVRLVFSPLYYRAGDPATKRSPREQALHEIRASFDTPIDALGGTPREVARTPEGKGKVESWLRDAERKGVPSEDDPVYLDLDSLRVELGLPTVASTFTPAPRGDVRPPPDRSALRGVLPASSQPQLGSAKVGRNDPCPCGSGKKYKKCCGA